MASGLECRLHNMFLFVERGREHNYTIIGKKPVTYLLSTRDESMFIPLNYSDFTHTKNLTPLFFCNIDEFITSIGAYNKSFSKS